MIKTIADTVSCLTYDVPVPGTPPVNIYLIQAQHPILVDCGAGDETYHNIQKDLAQLGLSLGDIGTILVTHNHIDHIGLASRIQKESGAPIYLHRDDWNRVAASPEERAQYAEEFRQILLYWGVPTAIIDQIRKGMYKILGYIDNIPQDVLRDYPERLDIGGIELEVIHCPGHTEGLVCFWWQQENILFGNDHLLEKISPNPTLYVPRYRGKRCGLGHYLESLKHVENLPIADVLPGHGDPYRFTAARIAELREEARERRESILARLDTEATVVELAMQLWDDLSPLQGFLASREVHGHLEILEEEGIVSAEKRDGVGYFGKVG